VLTLLGVGILGFRTAVQMLKEKVVEALGPGSEVGELNVGWSSVELAALSIQGPTGWPAARTLQADRVTIKPSLRSLLTNEVQLASVTVEKPYLSLMRVPGKLVIVPSLLDAKRRPEQNGNRGLTISKIVLQNGVIEIFDATVGPSPLKIRLEEVEGFFRDIGPAKLETPIRFELSGNAKGKSRDGRLKLSGWIAAKGRDSSSHIVMNGVDLVSLQPYLARRGDARVSHGTLDLNLTSEVRNNQLNGRGKMIIRDLEFAPSQNYLGTFMGLPRSAVVSFLKDHDNAINVDFTLSGDVRQPHFSLNEALATRVATGMAGQLGVSIQGVAEGLETLGRKGVESAGGAADAIGSALRGLFSGDSR
jgi:uncharacterized protein involved in outer membrane biogenesis